jgi:hypothetical protein
VPIACCSLRYGNGLLQERETKIPKLRSAFTLADQSLDADRGIGLHPVPHGRALLRQQGPAPASRGAYFAFEALQPRRQPKTIDANRPTMARTAKEIGPKVLGSLPGQKATIDSGRPVAAGALPAGLIARRTLFRSIDLV